MSRQRNKERYRELDALRGAAVLVMVLYHLLFDLAYFYDWNIPVFDGAWKILARTSATTFLLLAGLCFTISWHRASIRPAPVHRGWATQHDNKKSFLALYYKYLRRGLTILSGGMLISLATWLIAPHAFIKFGILHFIGISALLQPLFAPLKLWNAPLGILLLSLALNPTWFRVFPLGLPYPAFSSLDYYPLIPWFGVILLGMAVGHLLYVPTRSTALTPLDRFPYPLSLLQCGRWSLWIYFVHQPLILVILALTLRWPTT